MVEIVDKVPEKELKGKDVKKKNMWERKEKEREGKK